MLQLYSKCNGGCNIVNGIYPVILMEGFRIIKPVIVNDIRNRVHSIYSDLKPTELSCVVRGDCNISVYSGPNNSVLNAEGSGSILFETTDCKVNFPDWNLLANKIQDTISLSECTTAVDIKKLYEYYSRQGLEYGFPFRSIQKAFVKGNMCWAHLDIKSKVLKDKFTVPPNLIDLAFQTSGIIIMATSTNGSSADAQIPYAFDQVWIRTEALDALWNSDE